MVNLNVMEDLHTFRLNIYKMKKFNYFIVKVNVTEVKK